MASNKDFFYTQEICFLPFRKSSMHENLTKTAENPGKSLPAEHLKHLNRSKEGRSLQSPSIPAFPRPINPRRQRVRLNRNTSDQSFISDFSKISLLARAPLRNPRIALLIIKYRFQCSGPAWMQEMKSCSQLADAGNRHRET